MNRKNLRLFVVILVLCIAVVLAVAGCSPKDVTIIFETNGGSHVDEIVAKGGMHIDAPSAPTREGYVFGGWYTDEALEHEYTFVNAGNEPIKLYAKWIDNYDIVLHADGGVGESITSYKVSADTVLPTYTKAGYTFEGWYDNADFVGEAITTIPKGSKGDREYYAKWVEESITISFVTNGGSEVADIVGHRGDDLVAPQDPTREGYVFGGWYTDETLLDRYTFVNMGKESITLYAKWIDGYEVILHADGGVGESITSYKISADTVLPTYTKDGYKFLGWYDNVDFVGDIITTIPKGSNGDREYYAKWEILPLYDVILMIGTDVDTSSETFNSEYHEGDLVTLPNSYTKEGYTFAGWYYDSSFSGQAVAGFEMGTQSIRLYPKWTLNVYKLNFHIDKPGYAKEVSSMDVIYGDKIWGLPSVSKINKGETTFVAWYKDKELTDLYTGGIMPSHDVDLYARWNNRPIDLGFYPYIDKFKSARDSYIHIYSTTELVHFVDYITYIGEDAVKYHLTLDFFDGIASDDNIRMVLNDVYNSLTGRSAFFDYVRGEGCNDIDLFLKDGFSTQFAPAPNQYKNIEQIDSLMMSDKPNVRAMDYDSFKYKERKMTKRVNDSSQLFYALQYGYNVETIPGSKAESMLLQVKDILRSICDDGMTDIDKAYAIYSYIIENVVYDHVVMEAKGNITEIDAYDAFHADGVFDNGMAVCDGMSKAFTIMANVEGLVAIRVTSPDHAWNKIFVDGDGNGTREWYVIDCTWGNAGVSMIGPDGKYIQPSPYESFVLEEFMSTDSIKASHGQRVLNFKDCPAYTDVDVYNLVHIVKSGKAIDIIMDDITEVDKLCQDISDIVGGGTMTMISVDVKFAFKTIDALRARADKVPGDLFDNLMDYITKKIDICNAPYIASDRAILDIKLRTRYDTDLRYGNRVNIILLTYVNDNIPDILR